MKTGAATRSLTPLANDSRLIKVNRTHWGLASWDLPEYAGIAESMRNLLEESGGSVNIDEMVGEMRGVFGVAESSVHFYCAAPLFVVEGSTLRLRTPQDEPYRYAPDLLSRTPGVYDLGPKRLGRLLKVDRNILRGSGAPLTHAAGAILGITVNSDLFFTNSHGDRVRISFPETSHVGPTMGSVRQIAERLSAKEGDYLTLVLDGSELSVTGLVTDICDWSPGWDVVGRLTGLEAPADLDRLAKTLQCTPREVRSLLKERGDDGLLNLLPKSEASSSLDDALAALEDHVEEFRGGAR